MSYDRSPFALTPWVRRMLAAMGAVYLLQLTVFTSPWLEETFAFAPSEVMRRPWGLLTYALLHGSFLHLLFNAIGLFMFGPPVEARLGGRRFAGLLLAATLGGSLLSLALVPLAGDAPIVGASAAVFGVMLAFVLEWPDAPVLIFPLPMPVKAKWLVGLLAILALGSGILGVHDGVAHFAHVGGFAAAFLYLRGGAMRRRRPSRPAPERTPAVLVHPTAGERGQRGATLPPSSPPRQSDDAVRDEVDRVLDKISAGGLESLTPEERRFLDEMSKRFRQAN
jgi:membrane associated rhomboid family serine protease